MEQGRPITISINNTRGGHVIQNNNINGSIYINGRDDREEETKCMRRLFLTDPKIDRAEIVSRNGARVDGTCEWITNNETYLSWLSSCSQLLWLSGGPGRGKTTIAIYLAERFEEMAKNSQSCPVLEYYCSSQDEKRNTKSAVVRGLIYQLLDQFPKLFCHIRLPFERQSTSLFTSFDALWKIFAAMINDPVLPAAYCILDGLDEMSIETELMSLLTNFTSLFSAKSTKASASSFKLVIVSREFPNCLSEQLSNFPHIRLDPEADIRRFVDVRVDELAQHRHYSALLSSHVKEVFLKRAEGTFLWVAVVVGELRKYALTEVKDALNQFASGLDGLYTRMLLQIPEDRRGVAAKILSWVTLAVRPLTVAELSEVLKIKSMALLGSHPEDVTREHLRFCGNFLHVTGSTVQLVHLSAKEFLLRKTTYSDPHMEIFRVNEYLGNLEIARKCLSYLQEGGLSDGAFDIKEDRRRLQAFPLIEYATLHWFEHARLLSSSEDIFDLSCPFYKQKSSTRASWLQTYWASGKLRSDGEPVKQPELFPLLHLACYFGIFPLAQKILRRGRWKTAFYLFDERVNEVDSCGQTPLIWAAMKGHWPIVKLLLQRPNLFAGCKDAYGRTPLYLAAAGGYYTIAGVLLTRPDVVADSKCTSGFTPLMKAALGGHEAIVRLLVERQDVDINAKGIGGSTPLHWACWSAKEAVIQLLLGRSDIDPNLTDNYGDTALHIASKTGDEAVVRLLLASPDVTLDSRNDYEGTPLHCAAVNGHERVVRLLLGRSDVDVNKKIDTGSTPLTQAAMNGHEAVVRVLLDRPEIEPDLAGLYNRTPLSFAAYEGHEALVDLLLKRQDVDVNSKDEHGSTPLHHAASMGHDGVARLLLQRPDIEPDLRNQFNHTPIVDAAGSSNARLRSVEGHEAIVRMLLERPDVDIDYEDGAGWHPLYFEAMCGRNEAVIRLLQSLRPDWGSWSTKGGTIMEKMERNCERRLGLRSDIYESL